jgi:hypothetical protein
MQRLTKQAKATTLLGVQSTKKVPRLLGDYAKVRTDNTLRLGI